MLLAIACSADHFGTATMIACVLAGLHLPMVTRDDILMALCLAYKEIRLCLGKLLKVRQERIVGKRFERHGRCAAARSSPHWATSLVAQRRLNLTLRLFKPRQQRSFGIFLAVRRVEMLQTN